MTTLPPLLAYPDYSAGWKLSVRLALAARGEIPLAPLCYEALMKSVNYTVRNKYQRGRLDQ